MYYFIVNESSGSGKARDTWMKMKREMSAAGVPFAAWTTRCAGDATDLARAACRLPDESVKLIVVGGDGTINEVLNGLTDLEKVSLAVVPMGSGNDFVRGLGLPRKPRAAMDAVYHCQGGRRIDLGQVRVDNHAPRRFGISAGVGLDARVCDMVDHSQQKSWLNHLGLGNLAYGLKSLSVLAQMDGASGQVSFTHQGGVETRGFDKLLFLAAMNLAKEGGGVPVAPKALPNDGLFSACLVTDLSRSQAFPKLPLLAVGCHEHLQGVEMVDAWRIEVELDAPLVVHADGEIVGHGRHVIFELLPQALRLMV